MQEYRPSSFKLLPDVVKNIIIICGLAFFAEYVGMNVNSLFGLYLPVSDNFHWWQLITYIFMHGGWAHILLNMFALWMFGNMLENLWGPKRFLIFFMVTGIGAGLIQLAVSTYSYKTSEQKAEEFFADPGPDAFTIFAKQNSTPELWDPAYVEKFEQFKAEYYKEPQNQLYNAEAKEWITDVLSEKRNSVTVGASGSVFGILLAFGMLFPNTIIYLYFAIPVKAKYFVIGYGIIELISAIQNNPADNVAHFAHLGGMLFGFILIKLWNRNRNRFY